MKENKIPKKYENQINGKSKQENYNDSLKERQTILTEKNLSFQISSLLELELDK